MLAAFVNGVLVEGQGVTPEELSELELLASHATPPPWSAWYIVDGGSWEENFDCRAPDQATGGFVIRLDPDRGIVAIPDPDPKPGEWIVPDNGVMIACKREVNRGYDLAVGESVHPEFVDLKPHDAAFIAACRTAVPELIAEVRRLRGAVREYLLAAADRQEAFAGPEYTQCTESDRQAFRHAAAQLRYAADAIREGKA